MEPYNGGFRKPHTQRAALNLDRTGRDLGGEVSDYFLHTILVLGLEDGILTFLPFVISEQSLDVYQTYVVEKRATTVVQCIERRVDRTNMLCPVTGIPTYFKVVTI